MNVLWQNDSLLSFLSIYFTDIFAQKMSFSIYFYILIAVYRAVL